MSLIGRIVEEPEMRTGEEGEAVCAMRLAVPRFTRSGIREPGVVYVEVTTSGWQVHDIFQALAVGGRVGVTGRIALEEWVAPGGERKSRYEVMADQLELLDPPPGGVTPGLAA